MSITAAIMDVILLATAWLGYFLIHSLLASLPIKQWISRHHPNFMPLYRLGFNLIALLLLSLPFYTSYRGDAITLWQFNGLTQWIMNGIAMSAVIGFLISLKYYDSQEFLGIRQLRAHETRVEDQEHLQLSPLHRYVRHPWYTFALMLIWSRSMDSLSLTSAILITAYFIVGSRLEERKLIHYYGKVYEAYRQRVPALVPLPWRFLKQPEVEVLLQNYRDSAA